MATIILSSSKCSSLLFFVAFKDFNHELEGAQSECRLLSVAAVILNNS